MKIVLFDIDGTLLLSGKAPKRAFENAFYQLFGIKAALELVHYHGATDRLIHQQAANLTMSRDLSQEEQLKLEKLYLELLPGEIAIEETWQVLPGVLPLCEFLHRAPECILGLQTGNLEKAAQIKLRHANLDQYFRFGGFGSDAIERDKIVSRAHELAIARVNKPVTNEDVFVIGDTPSDIMAGKANNFRTIAVATGNYSTEELRVSSPDFLFSDFDDYSVLISAILQSTR